MQRNCSADSEQATFVICGWLGFTALILGGVTSHGMQVCILPKKQRLIINVHSRLAAHRYFTQLYDDLFQDVCLQLILRIIISEVHSRFAATHKYFYKVWLMLSMSVILSLCCCVALPVLA